MKPGTRNQYYRLNQWLRRLNNWRKQRVSNHKFLILAAAVVGVLGGIASSLLKKSTHLVANFLQNKLEWEYKYYLYLVFPLIGILLTRAYIRLFIRHSRFEHGITSILQKISRNASKLEFHNIYSQVITSTLTVGMGGSAGLEAPAVSSGAAIGSNLGRFFGLNYRETTLLLACGGAAGIAGAFNSPVAGMIFAIEVLLPQFSIPAVIPLLISAAFASVISNFIYGEPLFALVTKDWSRQALWFYVALGIVVGSYSVFYSRVNAMFFRRLGRIRRASTKAWLGGISLGVLIALMPALYGEGYITIQKLLDGEASSLLANSLFSEYQHIGWALTLFAALTVLGKTFASVITMASGGNGGMFGPTVVVGGLLGFVFAFGLNQTHLVQLNVTNFMIAGMAASVSGVMHAPLTGIFLAAEITGGYTLMVPLMLVSAIGFFINKAVLHYSIYTQYQAAEPAGTLSESSADNIIQGISLRQVLEKDFVVLRPEDTPHGRRQEIIHTQRNIFPVVDAAGLLKGIIYSERLLESLMSEQEPEQHRSIGELAQPAPAFADIQMSMQEVLQIMDSLDLRMLPVLDRGKRYLGFVSKAGIFSCYRSKLKEQESFFQ
ncbi:MAG: chloride channel protein [Bacteroidetes bacterium]|nr:chloride channel protein [Bacteroidota bacterium]MBS1629799.1 chloride channel protein [Bacteroidota bacterium]